MSSCRAAAECSPAYVTHAQDLADASQDTACDVLYVVGGLYGNVAALDALEEGIARERRHGLHIEVCFNGDFNFFNASTDAWARINQGVRALGHATAGNVESESTLFDPAPTWACSDELRNATGSEFQKGVMLRLSGVPV